MGHPHAHSAKHTSRSKFKALTGVKGGGHVHQNASGLKRFGATGGHEAWDSHKQAWAPEIGVHGEKTPKRLDRYARGGHTKKHGNVNIAIMQPHSPSQTPTIPIRPPIAARPPLAPPPGLPPPGLPAGPPPGGAPNPMAGPMGMLRPPGANRGGRYAKGGKVDGGREDMKGDYLPGEGNPENLRNWAAYASRNSYKTGGSIPATHNYPHMTAGANTGVGRVENAEDQRKRRKKGF